MYVECMYDCIKIDHTYATSTCNKGDWTKTKKWTCIIHWKLYKQYRVFLYITLCHMNFQAFVRLRLWVRQLNHRCCYKDIIIIKLLTHCAATCMHVIDNWRQVNMHCKWICFNLNRKSELSSLEEWTTFLHACFADVISFCGCRRLVGKCKRKTNICHEHT